MKQHTLRLHNKGWSVVDALKRWNFSRDSYDRWIKDNKYNDRLDDLINGLKAKEMEE